jgi:hypothetical protein
MIVVGLSRQFRMLQPKISNENHKNEIVSTCTQKFNCMEQSKSRGLFPSHNSLRCHTAEYSFNAEQGAKPNF